MRCRHVLVGYYVVLVPSSVAVFVIRFSLWTNLAVCVAVLLFVVPLLFYILCSSRRIPPSSSSAPPADTRVAPTILNEASPHPTIPLSLHHLLAKPWRVYTHSELLSATHNFSQKNIIGYGGQATVFRGIEAPSDCDDSPPRSIAVKRFYHVSNNQAQADLQFKREVQALSRASHRNVVEFYGYCIHGHERLLVYELVVSGSLHDCLFAPLQDPRRRALDWRRRLSIAQDAAHGLDYLHNHCIVNLLHLDLKPQNILLDEMLNAKIADFGLAKLIGRDEISILNLIGRDEISISKLSRRDEIGLRQRTQFGGTPGYMPPELEMSFQAEWKISSITKKADVYSFGMVLLQIVTGRPLSNAPTVETRPGLSFRDAASYLVSTRDTDSLLDAGLMGAGNEIGNDSWVGVRMAEVAAQCVEMMPTNRPTIKQVSEMLASISRM